MQTFRGTAVGAHYGRTQDSGPTSSTVHLRSDMRHAEGAGYLLEAKGLGSPLLVELPLFEVQHGLVHVDDAQLHLLLQGNQLPLAWCFHPGEWVIDARLGPVPPRPDGRLWKGWQNSA